MDLIIDGGATTYKYIIFKNDKQYDQGVSEGANFMHGIDQVHFDSIKEKSKIKNIYLFGAGIREEDDNSELINHIKKSFKNAKSVYVNNDLEIVALAFSDIKDCIVGIIGTGSNAARAKKGKLKEKIIAGGYMLGDQGSGFKLGKKVLQYYIENQFTRKEEALFKKQYGYDKLTLVSAVYEAENHKRFVASFSRFLNELDHKTRKKLLNREFYKYFRNVSKQIKGSERLEFNFVGSVANVYEDALRHAAYEQDIKINQIIKSPFERIDTIYDYIKSNFQKKK